MYPIDLQTILQVFATQSGELRATLSRVANIKGECQASVQISQGKIVSCIISYQGQPVLIGPEAVNRLMSEGILQWTYVPAPPPANASPGVPAPPGGWPQPLSEAQSARAFPVRASVVVPGDFASWPRLHRRIYQLSTGEKTVEEIARLLSTSLEQVNMALSQLIRQGLIRLR